jgi:hypothetical protein
VALSPATSAAGADGVTAGVEAVSPGLDCVEHPRTSRIAAPQRNLDFTDLSDVQGVAGERRRNSAKASGSALEHDGSADDGQGDLRFADLLRRNLRDVTIDHDEVGQLASLEGASGRFVER